MTAIDPEDTSQGTWLSEGSSLQYQILFEHMHVGFAVHEIVCDEDGTPVDYVFLDSNPAFTRLTGLRREDIIGRSVTEILPSLQPEWIERYGLVALTGRPERFEDFSAALGRHYEVTAFSPAPGYFATLFSDMTDRKEFELALQESEERLRRFIEASPSVTFALEKLPSGTIRPVWVSGNVSRILGFTELDVLAPGWWDGSVHPEDREAVLTMLRRLIETEDHHRIEYRLRHKAGGYIWVREQARLVPQDDLVQLVGSWTDVTDLHESEDRARATAHLNEVLLDSFPCVALLLRPSTREIVISNAAGRAVGAIPGAHCYTTWGGRDAACPWCLAPALWADGKPKELVIEAEGVVWDAHWIPVSDDLYMHYAFDITDRLRVAEALREVEDRHRDLVESLPVGVVAHRAGQVILANRAAAGIVGADGPEDLIGRELLDLVHPEYRDTVRHWNLAVEEQGAEAPLAEVKLIRLDEALVDVEVVSSPVVIDGAPAVSSIIRDVSAQKRAEAALGEVEEQQRRGQRLEAVGRLAGGIAHDLNNLLTAIVGHTNLLSVTAAESSADADLAGILDASDRAATLTRQLLAFSRRQALQPHVLDLNSIAESMTGLLGRLIGEDIELALWRAEDLWAVEADPAQMEQVIMNLVLNARDAMPEGGNLTIETANVELSEEYADSHVGSVSGSHVMIAVSDTGVGIDDEVLSHIFEPFYTTKEHGMGTGLGLSTVYGIVKQSGGNIWVYSELREGTTFKIYLPRAERPIDWRPEASTARPQPSVGGSETVLVVEDEGAVRSLVVRILERAGYVVLQEDSPHEALALFDEYGGVVHLLLTDVVLPDMSGKALAETLTARQGISPKVLFMSGYTQNAIVHNGRLDPDVHFLEKPFAPDGLLRKVREVLDRPLEGQLEMPL
ncbi:MAG: hybrid sensor histidine kinase/response regulator [Thermoleophilia bacterium]